jgi:putative tryptophan/tyrosine transport system substrate-binding protein
MKERRSGGLLIGKDMLCRAVAMATKFLEFLPLVFFVTIANADVGIVKTGGVIAFEEARNGFTSICFENNQQFDLAEDLSNRDEILNSLRSGKFNLIFAIGPQSANLVRENLATTPLVFAYVVDPEKQGFKKDYATGVALNVQTREQFLLLKSINRKIKRIGIIYTKGPNDPIFDSAKTAAENENLELIPGPINSNQDLQQVMTGLIGKVDALWIPPDPSLNSEEVIKYIGSKSLENKMPCVGPTDRYVRSGAIFSYAADNVEVGRMAGDLANKILQGTPTSKLPVQQVQRPKIIINLKAASLLGLTIPQNLQNAASKIYQ